MLNSWIGECVRGKEKGLLAICREVRVVDEKKYDIREGKVR